MQCRLDGSDVKSVIRRRRRNSRHSTQNSLSCSCRQLSIASSFTVDYSRPLSQLVVYVADSVTGDIWSVDEAGCHCQLIVNATTLSLTLSDIGQYSLDSIATASHHMSFWKTIPLL